MKFAPHALWTLLGLLVGAAAVYGLATFHTWGGVFEAAAVATSPYAALTITVAAPVVATTTETRVTILVYHIVRPSYASDSAAVRALALTPETFDAELKHLQESGYHIVTFADLEASLASSTPLLPKSVVLAFDDGWSDQYTYAFPILKKYHDTATFFVFTNAIGNKDFLTWAQLQDMLSAGMRVGDHSRSHPYLTKIHSERTLWSEIEGSKKLLEQKLGVAIDQFAYPFGLHNPQILALVKEAGFKSARGDSARGDVIDSDQLYALPALNAPTTLAAFIRRFP